VGVESTRSSSRRKRSSRFAHFIRDLADRLVLIRVQLTTDGHKVYLEAVEGAFGPNSDYVMLIKMYEGERLILSGTGQAALARE
jgi:hypothetical protein